MASRALQCPKECINWSQIALNVLFFGIIQSLALWDSMFTFQYIYHTQEVVDFAQCLLGPQLGRCQQKVMLYNVRLPAVLSIALTVAFQLLLVSCNAKVTQPPYCNSFSRMHIVPYINVCVGSFGVRHNLVQITSQFSLFYGTTCLEIMFNQMILFIQYQILLRMTCYGFITSYCGVSNQHLYLKIDLKTLARNLLKLS